MSGVVKLADLKIVQKTGQFYVTKAVNTTNSLLSLAESAFTIYAAKLPNAIKQIEDITGNLGTVVGRAKRAESAVNRLERAIQNGWVNEIKDVDTALENIWDAVGTRIILNNAKAENVDALITNLCNAIENNTINVIKVNNLKGNNGIGYLSNSNIAKIEQSVSKATGKPFTIVEGNPYDSGYTTVTVYIQYTNKVKGELQIIGKNALEIANAEHWVYDAFLGKPYSDYINAMSSPQTKNLAQQLIESVRKPAELLNNSEKQLYNNYLTEVYKNARKVEAELTASTVNLPANINKSLSIENLLKVEDYINKLKNGTANVQEINNFVSVNQGGDIVGSIIKNGNKVEYTNPAGKLLKWSEQSASDITNSINAAKNSTDVGRKLEGTVADFIKGEGKTVEGFGLTIKKADNSVATDIDVLTSNEIIEVKNSYSAWDGKRTQVNRFVNSSLDDFVNPYNKKAILYIETPLSEIQKTTILNTIPSNVSLVNSLNELKLILK